MKHSLFGCKVNKFYLNKWLGYFRARGYDRDDAHLVATCVVTDKAKSKRIRQVKKMLKDGEHVYLTGCGAFEQGEAMDYDRFFGLYPSLQGRRDQLTLLGEDPDMQTDLGAIGEYELNEEHDLDVDTGGHQTNIFTKKFVVIQSGCDTFCTFCLTIYRRGSTRNRTAEEIIDEINQFVDQGGKEIVITGVNLAARGASHTRKPKEAKLGELLGMILHRTAIERIRISSLGPEFLDDTFFDVVRDIRILPHFHFSIQHVDDDVLRLMNRNYDAAILDDVLMKTRNLDRPDRAQISIGGDLIVGFPGETDEAFQSLLAAIETYQITKLHAFPFSPHQKGSAVPAGKLPNQVQIALKKVRMHQLLELGDEVRKRFIVRQLGTTQQVLIESKKDDRRIGRTPNYIQCGVEGEYKRGELVDLVLDEKTLYE